MEILGELYHGWLVAAIPSDNSWTYKCWDPTGRTCSFDKAYRTSMEAVIAARGFVDRDITRTLLSRVLEEWLQTDLIHEEEFQQAQESIHCRTHPVNWWER